MSSSAFQLPGKTQAERGSITTYLLVLMALLTVVAGAFRIGVSIDLSGALKSNEWDQARRNALSGIAFCQAYWQEDPRRFQRSGHAILKGEPSNRSFGDILFTLSAPADQGVRAPLVSCNSGINVNLATREVLQGIPALSAQAVDSLLKVREAAPLRTWDALAGLSGWGEERLFGKETGSGRSPGLINYFTLFGDGTINVNLAPPEVLQAVTGYSMALLRPAVNFRNGPDGKSGTPDDGWFASLGEFSARLQLPPDAAPLPAALTTESTGFIVWVTGTVPNPRPAGEDGKPLPGTSVSLMAWLQKDALGVAAPVILDVTPRAR